MASETLPFRFGLVEHIRSKPRALRVGELAALLAVSERQIYALAAQHRIPGCFRIGGSLRFDPSAIAAWLLEQLRPGSDHHPQTPKG
jgi:excisionase family DNA binding protein